MAYENRTVQSATANALPTGTDPMVDNTASGDVQAIKLINPTAGSVAPWIDQAARAQSLPVAFSTEDAALLGTLLTQSDFDTKIGGLTETAPATDTASSGVNGRLQRIAQRLSSLVTGVVLAAGTALIGKVGIDQTTPGTTDSVSVATAQGAGATIGVTSGAKVITDANGTVQQYLRGLVSLWIGGLPTGTNAIGTVQPGNTQNTTPWLASPLTTAVDVVATRPADVTAYAANDEVTDTGGTIRTITSAARVSGGTVRLRAVSCVDSSNVATKAQLLVYIFDTTSTPATDNAAFAPTDAVLLTCVGVLPFNIWYPGDDTAGATGNAFSSYLGPEIDIKTVGSANLFFRIKVLNAYVPTSAETLTFRFTFVQY